MQHQAFRQALEASLSVQSVQTVVDKAYAFQAAENAQRVPRARYGTVKLAREADAMWDQVVANIFSGMAGRSDAQVLAQLQDDDFIDSMTESLLEIEFTQES
ncbi:hypothetical protein D0501_02095 [Leuconostoc holzapfelii]|uniref:Uncharacterized protein n=1 Tax=Leuconostoc holzapfelii TaxID=434464 RepID=A0ABT2NWD4_9LACO|nr:hypothetical protein [Leuconostoc holzapfelii]MCT8388890.1 hypothetical protein [Leuconostoc holzapfelii]